MWKKTHLFQAARAIELVVFMGQVRQGNCQLVCGILPSRWPRSAKKKYFDHLLNAVPSYQQFLYSSDVCAAVRQTRWRSPKGCLGTLLTKDPSTSLFPTSSPGYATAVRTLVPKICLFSGQSLCCPTIATTGPLYYQMFCLSALTVSNADKFSLPAFSNEYCRF